MCIRDRWKIGPEWVAQLRKLVATRIRNGAERMACPVDKVAWLAASVGAAAAPCASAGGRRISNAIGTMMTATRAAMSCSEVRQSWDCTSHAASGDMVIGAMPMPADTSDTARLRRVSNQPVTQAASSAAADAANGSSLSVGQAMRSAPFLILVLTSFLSCATHSGPIFHTVSYAVTCGIPLMAAVSIYSLEGLAGMGGRLVFGLLGDRFGAARVLVLALLAQAVVVLGYVVARHLGSFYTVAALFGFTYAGVMPLFAVIARENFPLRMMGTVIGGTTMASSLGMALGPVLGGLIYDTFSSYAWLFVGAFSLGIASFLAALAFTRLPRRQTMTAMA